MCQEAYRLDSEALNRTEHPSHTCCSRAMATGALKSYVLERLLRPLLAPLVRPDTKEHALSFDGGRVVLRDVDLHTQSPLLAALDLPVVPLRLIARRVELAVHWGDLLGQPLEITIEGVLAVLSTDTPPP